MWAGHEIMDLGIGPLVTGRQELGHNMRPGLLEFLSLFFIFFLLGFVMCHILRESHPHAYPMHVRYCNIIFLKEFVYYSMRVVQR